MSGTPEEESMLWEAKVICDHRPLALLRAVFPTLKSAIVNEMLIDVLIGPSCAV